MNLKEKFITWKNKRKYETNLDIVRQDDVKKSILLGGTYISVPKVEHFLHKERFLKYKDEISNIIKSEVSINFGDSLSDLCRPEMELTHDGIYSISGSWPHHIKQMALELNPYFEKLSVRNISIGCLGGNPRIVNKEYRWVLNEAVDCLDSIRSTYKNSRIIVYGLHPLYYIYNKKKPREFDNALMNWCINNRNSVYISLVENFNNELIASIEWKEDGATFNNRAALKFSKLLKDKMVNTCL